MRAENGECRALELRDSIFGIPTSLFNG
jgi:hypothetical protein